MVTRRPSRGNSDSGVILALDTGSPLVSVALGTGDELFALRSTPLSHSSEHLLRLVDEVLGEAEVDFEDLHGVVVLQGPGSFTGLRVGLATALGFHQATGTRATALPTLEVLAANAPTDGASVVAVVDALRGEWFAQPFAPGLPPRALAEPERWPEARLATLTQATVIGFGTDRLARLDRWPPAVALVEPGPLAPTAIRLAGQLDTWDAMRLTAPLYLRRPAVTLPPTAKLPGDPAP